MTDGFTRLHSSFCAVVMDQKNGSSVCFKSPVQKLIFYSGQYDDKNKSAMSNHFFNHSVSDVVM